jgi:hypothetical protein
MPRSRNVIKDVVIVIAILVLLLALALLFLRPPQPTRDFVFGILGRAPSALTNRIETPFPPPVLSPTNVTATPLPPSVSPIIQSNENEALTPSIQPTNDALSNAVARAMAAPPLVRAPQQTLSPLAPAPESGPSNFASTPLPYISPTAPSNSATAAPPYIPQTSEPDSKASTAELLATTQGYTPKAQVALQPKSTAALLDTGPASESVSKTAPIAASAPPSSDALPAITSGTNVYIIIDQSLSMIRDGKTIRARNEALRIVESLGPENAFYVLFFHSGGYEGMPVLGPVPATRENIDAMTNWLFSTGHRFGSDPSRAVRRALGMVPAPATVWLISDGGFSRGAAQAIREANETVNARINTIDLYNAAGEPVMRQIAADNHGEYRFIPLP